MSDSSARVKETKEASYDTDEGGFLLVFSLRHTGGCCCLVFFSVCYTTPRQKIPNTQPKARGEVLGFMTN